MRRVGVGAVAILAMGVYWVLLGGTDAGAIVPPLRAINAILAGACIWLWIREQPRTADAVDIATLIFLFGFLLSSMFSMFPRASLDAASAATGWAAALFIARRLAGSASVRRFALNVLALTGIAVALLFGCLWGITWIRWLALTDFQTWPPLSLALPTIVFRHPHVIAFAAVMMAPAVASLWRTPILRPLVVLTFTGTTFIALASGSRTIWLTVLIASGLSSVLLVGDREVSPRRFRQLTVLLILALVVFAIVWQSGVGQQVLDRVFTSRTLGGRSQIWQAALHAWAMDPLTGSGPGTFVQALPLSGYFQFNVFAPRHADNALIQLLSEGGLVAVGGAAAGASVVATRLWQSGMKSAIWAVAFVALSALTDNPTDTAGLNAIAIWWIALAIPARPEIHGPRQNRSAPLRLATIAALAVVGGAYVSLTSAILTHGNALSQAAAGDLAGARNSLQLSSALDPGTALYRRETGLVELATMNTSSAAKHLRQAYTLLPTDELTRRALAVTELMAGDRASAVRTIRDVVQGSPAIEANLLLEAWISGAANGQSGRQPILVALQRNPLLMGAPSWRAKFGEFGAEGTLLRAAWEGLETFPEQASGLTYQPMWLRAMASQGVPSESDLRGAAAADLSATSKAWVSLLSCQIQEATEILRNAQSTEGESGIYWFVRIAAASAGGKDSTGVRQRGTMVAPLIRSRLAGPVQLTPLWDPIYDRRMYGSDTLPPLEGQPLLPSGFEASSHWMLNPFDAADRGAPESALAKCR